MKKYGGQRFVFIILLIHMHHASTFFFNRIKEKMKWYTVLTCATRWNKMGAGGSKWGSSLSLGAHILFPHWTLMRGISSITPYVHW